MISVTANHQKDEIDRYVLTVNTSPKYSRREKELEWGKKDMYL